MRRIVYMFAAMVMLLQFAFVPTVGAVSGKGCDEFGTPIADIFVSDASVVLPRAVEFSGAWSSGCGDLIESYHWDFGDGATSDEGYASHVYSSAGTWTVRLTVTDEAGLSDTSSVAVSTRDANAAPVAVDDMFEVSSIATFSVIENDSDADGDALTTSVVTLPQHGRLDGSNGTYSYIPENGFTGEDSFTYQLADDYEGVSNVATVHLQVLSSGQAPVAADDEVTIDEDTSVTIFVLYNDTDPDGDTLRVALTSDTASGTVQVNDDQSITFTPNKDMNGATNFGYTITDGNGGYSNAFVHVTVNPVNDAPVAQDDTVQGAEDSHVDISVAANDQDPENVLINSFTVVQAPVNGSVYYTGAGNFRYTPKPNFNGTDSFVYRVTDEGGLSSTATVYITVTPAYDPVQATGDAFTTAEDTKVTGSLVANDFFEVGPLSTQVKDQPAYGTVTVNADGTFAYTPKANFNGRDQFTYSVTDGQGSVSVGVVSISVTAVNDNPVASFTARVDRKTVHLTNASSDIDGDALTYSWDFGDGATSTEASPTYTYLRKGTYTITLTVTDVHGATSTFTQTVTV